MPPQAVARGLATVVFVGTCAFAAWQGRAVEDPSRSRGGASSASASAPAELGFRLRECAKERGLAFRHENVALDPKLDNIAVQIAGLGAAVSVCDANGDGWADLYATTSKFGAKNALYVNQKDGTFRDVAGDAGLADVNGPGRGASMGTLWADADGDGDQECLLYRYGKLALFRNDGDLRFTEVAVEAGLDRWMNSNGATWIDYDRDGLLDLYVTGYFREDVDLWNLKTTKIMQASFEFATNGGHNYLFHNLGGLRFADVTSELGVDSTRWTLAVVAADLDGDGWQDLYLANDYGPEEYFRNVGGKRFERAQKIGLDESSKSGMSVTLGDIQNDGRLAVYVTNISKRGYLFQGNNLRLNRLTPGGGFLQNIAEGATEDCGWSWGSQFGDLDNDGKLDLVVLNGFVSANEKRDYWYAMTKLAMAQGSIAEDAANWPAQEDRSLSGYERSRLLLNTTPDTGAKSVRFVDVAEAAGLNDLDDGRAVAVADFGHRGALDVVVANQAGPLLFYANEPDRARHWIQFELAGRAPNTSAVGAQVVLHWNGRKTLGAVLAGSGFCSQSELALHFGLGTTDAVEKAVIRWPSGAEQTVERPAIDRRHRIEEPAR